MVRLEERMKVGPKGQVVIPKVFRKLFHIHPGSEVIFEQRENEITLSAPPRDPLLLMREIARSGPSIRKIDLQKAYEERMRERWKHKKFI